MQVITLAMAAICHRGWCHKFLGGQVELVPSRSDLHMLKGLWCFITNAYSKTIQHILCMQKMLKQGSVGMPPKKFWKFGHYKIEFKAFRLSKKPNTEMIASHRTKYIKKITTMISSPKNFWIIVHSIYT